MASPLVARAYTILEAVRLASDGDIPPLRRILQSGILKNDHGLRILLTYLPEGTNPESYIELLKDLTVKSPRCSIDSDQYPRLDISEQEACERARRIRLLPLAARQYIGAHADSLTLFLIHRSYIIDQVTGSLTIVAQLLEPFLDHSPFLRAWMISILLPLLRLEYEYYPRSSSLLSLEDFEKLDDKLAVQTLIAKSAEKGASEDKITIGRDLRGLVGPWMYGENARKRRRLGKSKKVQEQTLSVVDASRRDPEDHEHVTAWVYVNEWITGLALRDFARAIDTFVQWDGPGDVDYGEWHKSVEDVDENLQGATRLYAQAGLAASYSTDRASIETLVGSHQILIKVASLVTLNEPPDLKRSNAPVQSGIDSQFWTNILPIHLLHNVLLDVNNPLTDPSSQSLAFYNLLLSSCYKLLHLGNPKAARDVAHLILFGTETQQLLELQRTLYKLKGERLDDKAWSSVRQQILWLHNWEELTVTAGGDARGVFSKISTKSLEIDMLRAMLDSGSYTLALNIYRTKDKSPLPTDAVEHTVMDVALAAYDAASNGNRMRGGIRKASDIISTFREQFPQSRRCAQISALLSATHAMSFYTLSLQHGVPFRPVNIRAHGDPVSLIGKILDQNPRSYTHLDDLLQIGDDLVAASLAQQNKEDQMSAMEEDFPIAQINTAKRRITRMAIEAALAEDDFDTAYSYVVNRLGMADQLDQRNPTATRDDHSWRAAYAAGRYPSVHSSSSALRLLEQRMELLSQALLLAPAPALSEILLVWQQCEEQMMSHVAKEAHEEEIWDKKGSQRVPGGFIAEASPIMQKARDPTRGALQEEAPMGLFEVARGAASALSKNAFPLRGSQRSEAPKSKARPLSIGSWEGGDSDGDGSAVEGQNRVRKRDMVSHMVTGGLASGIGWVIGKPR